MDFALSPFEAPHFSLEISGKLRKTGCHLSLEATFRGDLDRLLFPGPETTEDLWRHTCLEWFIGNTFSERYIEINLSPAGAYQLYRFKEYRIRAEGEKPFELFPEIVKTPSSLFFHLALDTRTLVSPPEIQGVSAVVETTEKRLTYWALKHPNPQKPDFHSRAGWELVSNT